MLPSSGSIRTYRQRRFKLHIEYLNHSPVSQPDVSFSFVDTTRKRKPKFTIKTKSKEKRLVSKLHGMAKEKSKASCCWIPAWNKYIINTKLWLQPTRWGRFSLLDREELQVNKRHHQHAAALKPGYDAARLFRRPHLTTLYTKTAETRVTRN